MTVAADMATYDTIINNLYDELPALDATLLAALPAVQAAVSARAAKCRAIEAAIGQQNAIAAAGGVAPHHWQPTASALAVVADQAKAEYDAAPYTSSSSAIKTVVVVPIPLALPWGDEK